MVDNDFMNAMKTNKNILLHFPVYDDNGKILKDEIGWNRNTTYTIIKKCIEKGTITRIEPNFVCKVLISREQVQTQETTEFINKMFDGSPEMFFAAYINNSNLTSEQIEKLKQIVEKLK
jgi:predicted transcriptional regulator